MKEFDNNGLRLAEYQAKLFEDSVTFSKCSTKIFLRRFYHSDHLRILDKNQSSMLTLDTNDGLNSINEQFGESSYGKIKWNKNTLFWIGYIYRYISYTRNISTKYLMKLFTPERLKELYFTYHTQSNEWVVENLLIIHNLTEDIFDKNWRLKQIIKRRLITKETSGVD